MPTNEPLSKAETTIARTIRPTGLKQRSLLLMIVLAVVTFGLYYPIWFLRRRAALNGLDSPRKLQRWPFLLFLAFVALKFIVSIASGSARPEQTIGAGGALLLNLIQLAVGIVMLVQCFFIKDILEDHLAGPEDNISSSILSDRVKLSALMTFFFQIFYLQHVINRYIAGSQPKPV
jgi:Domain of unknown function (DUF4234)